MDETKTAEFISILQEYPALWKKQEKDFMNRDMRKRSFQEIATKMNVPEEDCKKRLKHLKDKMRDVCNKLPKTASGQPAFHTGEETVRWRYYKSLLFMKNQFVGRLNGSLKKKDLSSDALSPTEFEDDDDDDNYYDNESLCSDKNSAQHIITASASKKSPLEGGAQWAHSLSSSSSQSPSSKGAKHTEQFLETEMDEEKLSSLRSLMTSEGPKDEWRAYVDSLVHDLRMIRNPYLKINIKNAISNMVKDTIHQQLDMDTDPKPQQPEEQG